jgi:hypothetical protein
MAHIDIPTTHASGAARGARRLVALAIALTLTACGGAGAAAPGATAPEPSDDALGEHAERVRSAVAGWEAGTGIAVRVREDGGEAQHLLFAETTAPSWSDELAMWMIATVAASHDHTILGHLMIGLPALEPATLAGSAEQRELAIAMLLTSEPWDGQHPKAGWTINPGSSARIELRETEDGDLEGDFETTLVSNDGETTITVEQGYLYIKR